MIFLKGLPNIDLEDDFSVIGGDSLTALRIVNLLKEVLYCSRCKVSEAQNTVTRVLPTCSALWPNGLMKFPLLKRYISFLQHHGIQLMQKSNQTIGNNSFNNVLKKLEPKPIQSQSSNEKVTEPLQDVHNEQGKDILLYLSAQGQNPFILIQFLIY